MPYKQATTHNVPAELKEKDVIYVPVVRNGVEYIMLFSELTAREKNAFHVNRLIAENKANKSAKSIRRKAIIEARKERLKNKNKETTETTETTQSEGTPKLPTFKGMLSFIDLYRDNNACIDLFAQIRWRYGRYCPCCGSRQTKPVSTRKNKYRCLSCSTQFTPLTGTIFSDRKIPLYKMFLAMLYEAMTPGGVASTPLSVYIEVAQPRTFEIQRVIRHVAMDQGIFDLHKDSPDGKVYEVDTTRRNGEKYNLHVSQKSNHGSELQLLLVVKQRGGFVRIWPIEDEKSTTMLSILIDNLPEKIDMICTDEAPAFKELGNIFPGKHKTVVHCRKDYAHDDYIIEDEKLIESLYKDEMSAKEYREAIVAKELEMRAAGGAGLRKVRVYTNSCESWNADFKLGLASMRNSIAKVNTMEYANASAFRQNTNGMKAHEILHLMLENVARLSEPVGLVKGITPPQGTNENNNAVAMFDAAVCESVGIEIKMRAEQKKKAA